MSHKPVSQTPDQSNGNRNSATGSDAPLSQTPDLTPNEFFLTQSFKEGVDFEPIEDITANMERKTAELLELMGRCKEATQHIKGQFELSCTDISRTWVAGATQLRQEQDSDVLLAQRVRSGDYLHLSAVEAERRALEAVKNTVQSALTRLGPRSIDLASRAEAIRQRERQRKGVKPSVS